jgi:hypothetical protein
MSEKITYEYILDIQKHITVYRFSDSEHPHPLFSAAIEKGSETMNLMLRKEYFELPEIVFAHITLGCTMLIVSQGDEFYQHDAVDWGHIEWAYYRDLRAQGIPPLTAIDFVEL